MHGGVGLLEMSPEKLRTTALATVSDCTGANSSNWAPHLGLAIAGEGDASPLQAARGRSESCPPRGSDGSRAQGRQRGSHDVS